MPAMIGIVIAKTELPNAAACSAVDKTGFPNPAVVFVEASLNNAVPV